MSKKYSLSVELLKYPYYGRDMEPEDLLSERICYATIQGRKRLIKKTKRVVTYAICILIIGTGNGGGLVYAQEVINPPISRSTHSDDLNSDNPQEKLASFRRYNYLDMTTRSGKHSIFAEAYVVMPKFPGRPFRNNYDKYINNYDQVEKRIIKAPIMLQAHITCKEEFENLPRQIDKRDKKIQFGIKYSGLFKEHCEDVFGYNVSIEGNLPKDASRSQIKKAKQKLFKDQGEEGKKYLQNRLFQNASIIKSEQCQYLETGNFVTIYYNQFNDLFAIVDQKDNCLLDFGFATKVTYAEIFAYKSCGVRKPKDLCVLPNQQVKSTELEIYSENTYLSYDDALDILTDTYGSNFIFVSNNEFKIQDWQIVKKLEHAVCFSIKPEDYGFSQAKARKINAAGANGGLVSYVQKVNELPSLDLIRAFQTAIKNFCEDPNRSVRNDESSFRGDPVITFFNRETRQIVIFDQKTKIFITAYKLADRSVDTFMRTGRLGEN